MPHEVAGPRLDRTAYATKSRGHLEDRKAANWRKPLSIALIIIGLAGIAVACTGLASLSNHQQWWQVGGVAHITRTEAIIMLSVGGVLGVSAFSIGIFSLVKAYKNKESEIFDQLENQTWTFMRRDNGRYVTVTRHAPKEGLSKGEIVVAERDYDFASLGDLFQFNQQSGYQFIETDCQATDLFISKEEISETLKAADETNSGSFTFVRQLDGNYTLVVRSPDMPENRASETYHPDCSPTAVREALKEKIPNGTVESGFVPLSEDRHHYCGPLFVQTSELPEEEETNKIPIMIESD